MFELNELYVEARELTQELHQRLKDVQFADVDDTLVVARRDLRYWCSQYRQQQARWADGFEACQRPLDALRGKAA